MLKHLINKRMEMLRLRSRGMGRRAAYMLLCIAMLISMFSPLAPADVNAQAADDSYGGVYISKTSGKSSVKALAEGNLFVLRVDTGIASGENVLYIGIRYKDTSGTVHTEYIFPNEDSLSESRELANEFGKPYLNKINTMQNVASHLDTSKVFFLNNESANGLQSNSTDEYLFIPRYQFSSLEGFDVMMRNSRIETKTYSDKNVNSWTCNALQLYKAEDVAGYDMAGYYSANVFLSYKGTLVGEMEMPKNSSGNNDSLTFNAGTMDRIYRVRSGLQQSAETIKNLLTYTADNAPSYYKYNSMFDNANRDSVVTFQMDFADVSGAGVEGLTQKYNSCKTISEWNDVFEAITVNISYEDIFGNTQVLDLPGVLSFLCYCRMTDSLKNAAVFDIAQMGESFAFPMNLPGFNKNASSAPKVTVTYGAQQAREKCSLTGTANTSADQFIYITGVQIYSAGGKIEVEDYKIKINNNLENLLFYHVVGNAMGSKVTPGGSLVLGDSLKKYDSATTQKLNLRTEDNSTRYLVKVTTDSPELAGTKSKIFMDLTYTNNSGETSYLKGIDVKSCVEEYYGEWPTNPEGGAYGIMASGGGELTFFVKLNDVKKFTAVKFYLGTGSTDDWQFNSITIDRVNDYSERKFSYNSAQNQGSDIYKSNWSISREVSVNSETGNCVNYSGTQLIQGGTTGNKEIEFGAYSQEVVTTNDVNWNDYRYSMSYEDTLQDMGYVLNRCSYEVTVQVSSDKNTDSTTGDSGSQNMFYFQLLFEDGRKSGYVLANQQLASDGFRSGMAETFTINMNYDFGDVTGIRIIPDDTISEEDNFDKLQVDYIQVKKESNGALSQIWRVDVNGWISIDYHDSGAKSSAGGQTGRSEGELARSFATNSTSYAVNFVVEVATDGYDFKNGTRMTGVLFATFSYYDVNGSYKTKTVDVYEKMYEYMNKTALNGYTDLSSNGEMPILTDEATGEGNNALQRGAKIDLTTMLNEGTSNYFILSLTAPKEILGVEFFASSETVSYWNLSSVKIRSITGGNGNLEINGNNTYERDYTTVSITESNLDSYQLYTPNNATQNLPISFKSNDIKVDTDSMTWKSIVGREPNSINDTLNIYVHMVKPAAEGTVPTDKTPTPISRYGMRLIMDYKYDDSHGSGLDGNIEVSAMEKAEGDYIFYYKGLNASGISSISDIQLRATENGRPGYYCDSNYYCPVSYVVIEQIRSNVIIRTYYVEFPTGDNNANTSNTSGFLTGNPSTRSTSIETDTTEHQKLIVSLGTDFESFTCQQDSKGVETQDIVFALYYTTTTGVGSSYYSRNVFLSDFYSSNNGNNTIDPGQIIEVEFSESNVDEILGVQMIAQGVDVSFDGAYVECTNGDKVVKTYSIDAARNTVDITTQPQLFRVDTGRTMVPVTLSFKTASNTQDITASCNDRIRMVLSYEDTTGSMFTYTVDDLNKKLASGSFQEKDTAVVELLIPDFSVLHYIELEPMDNSDTRLVNWNLESVSVTAENVLKTDPDDAAKTVYETQPLSKVVNKNIYEGDSYKVSFSSITIAAKVMTKTDKIEIRGSSPENGILVSSKDVISIIPLQSGIFALGSSIGVEVKAERYVGDSGTAISGDAVSATRDTHGWINSIIFTAPENETTESKDYRITIKSLEDPSKSIVIKFTVEGVTTSIKDQVSDAVNEALAKQEAEKNSADNSGEATDAKTEETDAPAKTDEKKEETSAETPAETPADNSENTSENTSSGDSSSGETSSQNEESTNTPDTSNAFTDPN